MKNNVNSKKSASYDLFEGESIHNVSNIIAKNLRNVLDTFDIDENWTACDIGGTFIPSCREMKEIVDLDTLNFFNGKFEFLSGTCIEFDNIAYLLYYENLRRNTNLQFFSAELYGNGLFELKIIAQTDTESHLVFKEILELNGIKNKFVSQFIEVNTLIPNGSLLINLRCLSEDGFIEKTRWKGYVHTNQINSGERIVAIRTFGNRASVASSLKSIANRISQTNPNILKRTLFVIYDATGDKAPNMISNYVHDARIIEMQGPNYGGGGNASALISMILRAGSVSDEKISEVILFDDDAHIDAETVIRHDAFVTARKKDVISTSVVYSRQKPTIIQEFGGYWGCFFNEKNHSITLSNNDDPRLFFPYLVRSTRDVGEKYNARYIAKHQNVEFSTFIFISFPFDSLTKSGPPLPFFLRNDDAEICLRLRESGCKIMVNPNLSAWHDSAHNPISEFYATLHGLIMNAKYGGISRGYFYKLFMQRISCLANVGNLVLLTAYEKSLELYALGPHWMSSESIYQNYNSVRMIIGETMNKDAVQVPWEVIDVMLTQKRIDIFSIVDSIPTQPKTDNIVFVDTKEDIYWSFKSSELNDRITVLIEKSLGSLNYIADNFDNLTDSWSNYVSNFDHNNFWNELLNGNSLFVTNVKFFEDKKPVYKEVINLPKVEKSLNVIGATENEENQDFLPRYFNPSRYLELNPDVAAEGIDPAFHWLNYGRYESREY
jgi:GT2 family glycosyltransferase